MRAALGFCLVGSAMALKEVDQLNELSGRTCGNCYKTIDSRTVCNSGGDQDIIPFAPGQTRTAGEVLSPAQALHISEIKALVGQKWQTMFCSAYLDMYKYDDGLPETATTEERKGAACVRGNTRDAILQADEDARRHYNLFGTENGYPSSYAVPSGTSLTDEMRRFGVDGEGDVPSNWCGTYMRYMLCHVAFPQVLKTLPELQTARAANSDGMDIGEGAVRNVHLDSCEGLFRHCNRREPSDEEVKGDYVHPTLLGARPLFFEDNDRSNIEQAVENSFYCESWRKGHGLAQAGTAVSDKDDERTISFSAAGAPVASIVAAVAFALMALLL